MNELEDDSLMPIGRHKGKEMINVPASYLIWFKSQYKDSIIGDSGKLVLDYIEDNLDVLNLEILKESKNGNRSKSN